MEIIIGVIFVFLVIGYSYNPNSSSQKPPTHNFYNKCDDIFVNHIVNRRNDFEESDSVFDSNGYEHLVDEEGYCDECDEYHDDW